MSSQQSDRRQFLKGGAALVGGFALGPASVHSQDAAALAAAARDPNYLGEVPASAPWEAYGVPSGFDKSARIAWRLSALAVPSRTHQSTLYTPLQDQTGIIPPSGLHFSVNHDGCPFPDLNPQKHRLLIHGMVERPVTLTMEDIRRLPSVSQVHFIECNANT